MMGKKSGQMQICIIDIGKPVPENHLLKKIDRSSTLNSYTNRHDRIIQA